MTRLHHSASLCITLMLAFAAAAAAVEPPPTNDIRSFAGIDDLPQQRSLVATPGAEQALTPEQLELAYSSGFVGAFIDGPDEPDWAREAARQGDAIFASTVDDADFQQVFPAHWAGVGSDLERAVYWNFALRFDGDPAPVFKIQQITGNCVAASASDVSLTHCYGVAIFLLGREIEWRGPGSTVQYAYRGHCGQGANLGTIAAAIARTGFVARQQYGSVDLRSTQTDQALGRDNCRNPDASLAALWAQTRNQPIGRVAKFSGGLPELLDLLAAGGSLQTGGRITASKDGRPISRQASVGPHAQSIIGYDNSAAMKARFEIDEPVFFFSQTWGNVVYVQSGWAAEWWGKPPQGVFILPWSVVKKMLPGSYAYWPDLTGFTPETIPWSVVRGQQAAQRETRFAIAP